MTFSPKIQIRLLDFIPATWRAFGSYRRRCLPPVFELQQLRTNAEHVSDVRNHFQGKMIPGLLFARVHEVDPALGGDRSDLLMKIEFRYPRFSPQCFYTSDRPATEFTITDVLHDSAAPRRGDWSSSDSGSSSTSWPSFSSANEPLRISSRVVLRVSKRIPILVPANITAVLDSPGYEALGIDEFDHGTRKYQWAGPIATDGCFVVQPGSTYRQHKTEGNRKRGTELLIVHLFTYATSTSIGGSHATGPPKPNP